MARQCSSCLRLTFDLSTRTRGFRYQPSADGPRIRRPCWADTSTMLIAYFDDSGHSRQTDFVSIAACVGRHDQWNTFDQQWNAAWARHNAPYPHMREYAHSLGPYEGWQEPQRRGLMADCLAAVAASRLVLSVEIAPRAEPAGVSRPSSSLLDTAAFGVNLSATYPPFGRSPRVGSMPRGRSQLNVWRMACL